VTILNAKIRKVLIATIIIVVLVLVIQGAYALFASPLQLSIVTDKSVYQVSETVKISFTLRNVLLLPADISFRGYLFDFVVRDEEGNEIYWWMKRRLFDDWPEYLFLMPSQASTKTLEWNQVDDFEVSVLAGTYKIIGSTTFFAYTGKEYRLEVEATITIAG